MTTYVLNCKTALLFAFVKDARERLIERWEGGKGRVILGLRACDAPAPALWTFVLPIMRGKTDCFAAYIQSSASQSKKRKNTL